uniref:Kazrin, periplakin interacting protein n=1 Tax=Myotis lucifugus TaxID=59463 RepID=G1PEM1_MYOLU
GVGPGPDPGPLEKIVALGVSVCSHGGKARKAEQTGLLREEVSRLQEEVHLLRQMKEMLTKDLEESQGGKSAEVLSATELRVQLAQKEQELARAKEALQAMKADRKRLKGEKTDLVSQMQQLYATLESREEQLRDFIRNYEQHRKESEDAVKALAKEKDLLEREKWELRRQAKEATDHATALRSQLDLKDNRMKELEAELAMAKQSLATLTKDVPKRHSLAMPGETVLNGNQEWVVQADLPLTAAIRQSQQTLYHSHPPHPADRQAVRVSPCHSRQPSVISDASAAEGDRSSTPSDINSPRHRTHSLCNGDSPGPVQKNLHNPIVQEQSLEDLEDQKRKKKKEKMGFGSISRVFARGKQRKSLDPGLFDDSDSQCSPTRQSLSLSEGEEQVDRLQQVELVRTTPMSHWKAGAVQAWLEVVMAMPMYVKCAENVKSGKVLLSLSDEDLELGLGVCSSLHRRKLRLAIEDYRDAEAGRRRSRQGDLDRHNYLLRWLPIISVHTQMQAAFENHKCCSRTVPGEARRNIVNFTNWHSGTLWLAGVYLHQQGAFSQKVMGSTDPGCPAQGWDPAAGGVGVGARGAEGFGESRISAGVQQESNPGLRSGTFPAPVWKYSEAEAQAGGATSGSTVGAQLPLGGRNGVLGPPRPEPVREGSPDPGSPSEDFRFDSYQGSCGLVLSPQLPLGKIGRGFSSKEPDFHDDYGSLHNEDCGDEDLEGRPEQCRLEGYNGLEVTNV